MKRKARVQRRPLARQPGLAAQDSALYSPELFVPGARAASKPEALALLVDRLVAAGAARDASVVLDALLARERFSSTALGGGIAIPHCRSLMVSKLCVVFGSFPEGVPFDAPDREPVVALLLVAAPDHGNEEPYRRLLAELTGLAKQPRVAADLGSVAGFPELLHLLRGGSSP